MSCAIEVEDLSVNYHKSAVLWDITFSAPKGALIGIIGPNGAGKSTLLKALLDIVKPLSGKVRFFGESLKKTRHRIAYVPQRSSVDWDFPMTALDLVLMGRNRKMGCFRWASKQDKEAAGRALEQVEMESIASRQIGELSGGQQQRLFIARALAQEADLFLLDEPFAGVDLATETALLALFSQLKNAGKTVVIVHHDLLTVKKFFDYLVLLNTCLIASGGTKEVFTPHNLAKTYGHGASLLEEAIDLL